MDALSRNPLPTCLLINEHEDGLVARLRRAQWEDDELKKISEDVEKKSKKDYVVRGGLLFKEVDDDLCLVVPRSMFGHH